MSNIRSLDDEFNIELKRQYLSSVQNGNPNQTILELLKESERRKALECELLLRQSSTDLKIHNLHHETVTDSVQHAPKQQKLYV